MISRKKAVWTTVSLGCLLVGLGTAWLVCQKTVSLPFRQTNDALHEQDSPITLDLLIPAGIYIDEKMTIGQVVRLRFQMPGSRLTLFLAKISGVIPVRYRLVGTAILYVFWTFLFLVFFRIFTWMRYASALGISFLCGAIVYFFMPDLIIGRLDDWIFLVWSFVLLAAIRWRLKRKRTEST